MSRSAIARVARLLDRDRRRAQPPRVDSFADFLRDHARVKTGSGYGPYRFAGREALLTIVERIDAILAAGATDVSLALCGGAQFGKTVLMLNLLAYLVAVRFRNVGYYLPDDDLVAGLVDGKLRPDVLDQVPWLARLIAVGRTLSPSGRAVNRKGAFLCTDGTRTALAFMRGLGKIPTSFSMDVVVQDEKDDLPEEHARFLGGRMTASDLRLTLIIGTQRYHGAGQNLAFTEGTQHIGLLTCPNCGQRHNPETAWPGICRLQVEGLPPAQWPRLTAEGDFREKEEGGRKKVEGADLPVLQVPPVKTPLLPPNPLPVNFVNSVKNSPAFPIPHASGQTYVLACPDCGTALDRHRPAWHPLAPEREAQRRFSYRISQLLIPAIDLAQIVAAWQQAIRDPGHMTVFCADRLALPRSASQTLTPHILETAREPYELGTLLKVEGGRKKAEGETLHSLPSSSPVPQVSPAFSNSLNPVNPVQNVPLRLYAGLDLGDQCWFVVRAVESRPPHTARLAWIEPIAAERVRQRVPELFHQFDLAALCVDAGPLRDLSRDLAFLLNDLGLDARAHGNDPAHPITFTRDGQTLPLRWNPATERWLGLRCAPVEFTQRGDQGLRHKLGRTQDGRFYPLLAANRDETIARIVAELHPTDPNRPLVHDLPDGSVHLESRPRFRLPTPTEPTRAALDLYERHLLAGARQETVPGSRTLRYLDKCENHYLLATAYAALAELIVPPPAPGNETPVLPAFRSVSPRPHHLRTPRGLAG